MKKKNMYIDCHVHGNPNDVKCSPEDYVESCREKGIEAIVLIESMNRCLEAVSKFDDFIIPVARVNMDSAGAKEIEDCIEAGCKGIKFIRPSVPYGDERYWPMYERIEELDAVAVFHTGYLGFHERESRPVWMEHMRASQVEVVARRFPELKILMAHFSNPWWEEAWKVSWTRKNIYADLSGGTAIHRSTKMWADMFAPDGNLLVSSIKKLCFGSDVKYFRQGIFHFQQYIDFYEKIYDRIELSEDLRDLINRRNIKMLFNLD
jgi:predicted TIM-barrel fold metal-dependent hydrolase